MGINHDRYGTAANFCTDWAIVELSLQSRGTGRALCLRIIESTIGKTKHYYRIRIRNNAKVTLEFGRNVCNFTQAYAYL